MNTPKENKDIQPSSTLVLGDLQLSGGESVKAALKQALDVKYAPEVLAIFFEVAAEKSSGSLPVVLTAAEICRRVDEAFPKVSVRRALITLEGVDLLVTSKEGSGGHVHPYALTDLGRSLASGPIGEWASKKLSVCMREASARVEDSEADKVTGDPSSQSAELRATLAGHLAREVLGIFFQKLDKSGGDHLRTSLTRGDIQGAVDSSFAPTSLERCLANLVASAVLERREPVPGKRGSQYVLTELGIKLAQGEYGVSAREAITLLLAPPSEIPTENVKDTSHVRALEKLVLPAERLAFIGAIYDPTLLGFARGVGTPLKELACRAWGASSSRVAYDEIEYLVAHGVIRKAGYSRYELTDLGRVVYSENRERIEEQLKARQEALASGADPVALLKSEIHKRVGADQSLVRALDWLLEKPSLRISFLLDAIRSSESSPDGKAVVNHVLVSWFRHTGERIPFKTAQRGFRELHERDLLDANNVCTALAIEARKILRELSSLIPSEWRVVLEQDGDDEDIEIQDEERPFEAREITDLEEEFGILRNDKRQVETGDTEADQSIAPESRGGLEPVGPPAELPSKPASFSLSSGPSESSLVKRTRELASQLQGVASALDAGELREVDRERLTSIEPGLVEDLLPAARSVRTLERAVQEQFQQATIAVDAPAERLRVNIHSSQPDIATLMRLASRNPGALPAGWSVSGGPNSSATGSEEEQAKRLLDLIQVGNQSITARYPGIRQDLLHLGKLTAVALSNPLLNEAAKSAELKTAIAGFQEFILSCFYARTRERGYPSCHDADSNVALQEVRGLCDLLSSSTPKALGVAMTALRMSENPHELAPLVNTVWECGAVLDLVGLSLADLSLSSSPSKASQSARLQVSYGGGPVSEIEFKSLTVQGCGLIVRERKDLPLFEIVSVRISPSTDVVELATLLREFELERQSAVQRFLSKADRAKHKPSRRITSSEFSHSFRPPLSQAGAITVSNGSYGRVNTVSSAGFFVTFVQRGPAGFVEPIEFSSNDYSIGLVRQHIDKCFEYNLSLVDGLLHGPRHYRLEMKHSFDRQELPPIQLLSRGNDTASAARWLNRLADKVAQGEISESFLPLLASSPPSKNMERALLGAEALSTLLANIQSAAASKDLVLQAVESYSDVLRLELSGRNLPSFKALLETEEHVVTPEIVHTESAMSESRRVSSVAQLAKVLRNSEPLRAKVSEYLSVLTYLEGILHESRFDVRSFREIKAGFLHEQVGDGHNVVRIIGLLGELSSYEVYAALKTCALYSSAESERGAATITAVLKTLVEGGFGGVRIRSISEVEQGEQDSPVQEWLGIREALNPALPEHVISDSSGPEATFRIFLSWGTGELGLSPRIMKVGIAPNVDIAKLAEAVQGIHEAILDAFATGRVAVREALASKVLKARTLYIRDRFSRDSSDLSASARAVWVTDGVPFVSTAGGRLPEVELDHVSYGLRVTPVSLSKALRVDRCFVRGPGPAHEVLAGAPLAALEKIVLEVLSYNAEVLRK